MPQFDANAAIGQALRAIREEKGLTRQAVADSLGVGPMTVYRWEDGTRSPSPRTLCALAVTYDTEPSAFMPTLDQINVARKATRGEEG